MKFTVFWDMVLFFYLEAEGSRFVQTPRLPLPGGTTRRCPKAVF
jgi:hypothetical protein